MVATVATTVVLSATKALSINEELAGGSDVALPLLPPLPLVPPPPHAATATTQMTPSAKGANWRELFFIAALHEVKTNLMRT
jgi:hypothetical protein